MNTELMILQIIDINTSRRWPKCIRYWIIKWKFKQQIKNITFDD